MKRHPLALVGVLALALLIPLIPAGQRVFWGSNETRYPLLAQNILDQGRWLVPELRSRLYLNKPQLHFWAIAVASLPAGRVSELSAAIPSVLSAVAAAAAVLAIGTRLWGRRAGLLAVLIVATTPPIFVFGHIAIPDMMLAACLTWALYWFLRAWRSDWARGPLTGFYLCVALAVAAKGPPGYAALVAAAVTVLGTEGRRGLARLRPALGLLILTLCMLPWIVPYYIQARGEFQSDVLVGHYGTWFFRGRILSRLEGIGQTLASFLPWSIFLVAAPWAWRRAPDEGRRRILLWTATLWVLFVFTGTPRAHYLVPVYPLFALLTAELLAGGAAHESPRPLRIAAGVVSIYAVGMALVLILRPTLLANGEDAVLFPDAGWERGVVAAVLLAGAIATYLLGQREAWTALTAMVALTLAVTLVLAGFRYPGRHARAYDVRPLAAAAARHLGPGGTVYAYPDLPLSYDFYLRRPVVELTAVDRVLHLLANPKPGQVLVTSRERWQDMISRAPSAWRVLATRTVDGREMVVVGSPGP
jgi:4-amino-4-deoxy-L-arabinose transferase-like glycosyltransferase